MDIRWKPYWCVHTVDGYLQLFDVLDTSADGGEGAQAVEVDENAGPTAPAARRSFFARGSKKKEGEDGADKVGASAAKKSKLKPAVRVFVPDMTITHVDQVRVTRTERNEQKKREKEAKLAGVGQLPPPGSSPTNGEGIERVDANGADPNASFATEGGSVVGDGEFDGDKCGFVLEQTTKTMGLTRVYREHFRAVSAGAGAGVAGEMDAKFEVAKWEEVLSKNSATGDVKTAQSSEKLGGPPSADASKVNTPTEANDGVNGAAALGAGAGAAAAANANAAETSDEENYKSLQGTQDIDLNSDPKKSEPQLVNDGPLEVEQPKKEEEAAPKKKSFFGGLFGGKKDKKKEEEEAAAKKNAEAEELEKRKSEPVVAKPADDPETFVIGDDSPGKNAEVEPATNPFEPPPRTLEESKTEASAKKVEEAKAPNPFSPEEASKEAPAPAPVEVKAEEPAAKASEPVAATPAPVAVEEKADPVDLGLSPDPEVKKEEVESTPTVVMFDSVGKKDEAAPAAESDAVNNNNLIDIGGDAKTHERVVSSSTEASGEVKSVETAGEASTSVKESTN